MALTDTALKALKPRDKTYTVTDDRELYAEVFPTGGVVWRYRYRLNDKYEKLTLKNARLKRDEAAHQVAMGESPAKKKQQEKVAGAEDATVAEFAERFFKDRRYISTSLKREFASENGTKLNALLPRMSPLNPEYLTKKQSVFQKIAAFVEKFKGVGGHV